MLSEGWEPAELPEVIKAHGRQLGVKVPTEHAELLASEVTR
jgi:DNA polymerase III delta subunit